MVSEYIRERIIKILIVAGLCIAILSALEPHVEVLSSLCGFLGDGCRDTEQFSLFHIPVSIWGIMFYIVLLIVAFFAGSMTFWLIMCGVGVELALVRIMIAQNFVCVFCLLNLLVIILLFIFTINKNRLWQAATLCLLLYVGCDIFLFKADSYQKTSIINLTDSYVIAVVGGIEIDETELMTSVAGRLYKLERNIYNLKRRQLDKYIQELVIKLEAKEKGISVETLKSQIFSNVKKVSETEIENYYLANLEYYKTRKEPIGELKQKIKDHLLEKQLTEKMDNYIEPLEAKYDVVYNITAPALPEVNIKDSKLYNPENAVLTIVEFSDYMCPSCRRAHKITNEIKEQYKGKIKWIFKDYPLNRHKGAKKLAAAARCAGEQGKFQEYQDLLFASDGKSDNATLIQYAEKLGLDINQFVNSLNSNKFLLAIEKDIRDAKKIGVSSTPTFIINGKLNPGAPPLEKFKKMIDDILSKK